MPMGIAARLDALPPLNTESKKYGAYIPKGFPFPLRSVNSVDILTAAGVPEATARESMLIYEQTSQVRRGMIILISMDHDGKWNGMNGLRMGEDGKILGLVDHSADDAAEGQGTGREGNPQ